jgi:DNA primase
VPIYDVAARFFRERLADSWVPDYLAGRGLGSDVLERWQVGYAPAARDALIRRLRRNGYSDQVILAAGLARSARNGRLADLFRDRAMLPIRSPRGTIIAFIGRVRDGPGLAGPRYLNSPATSWYAKSETLFGLWEAQAALVRSAIPVIAEGPLDVLAIAAASDGGYGPVAPCGIALSPAQVKALQLAGDLRATGVMVAFDADDAGQRAAVRAYHRLSPVAGRVWTMTMPPGYDPARLAGECGPATLRQALAHGRAPLADLVLDAALAGWEPRLRFAEGQIGALRTAAAIIAMMPPPDVARQVGHLADRLGLDFGTVTQAVADAVTCGPGTWRSAAFCCY